MVTESAPLFAGVELGGTKCICILGRGPHEVIAQEQVPTRDPETTLSTIEGIVDGWHAAHDIAAIGLASFGPLELDPAARNFGHVTATSKPSWSGAAIQPRIAARYGLPTGIDTDVVGAALAEGRWGSAQGLASFVYVTVGTGVGAGVIVNGKPVRGIGPAEAGHMRVPRIAGDEWAGSCPYHGDCVEGIASGSAIETRAGAPAATLAADDPIWETVVGALAGMLHNLVLTASPSRILIGGGVAMRQPHLIGRIRAALVKSLAGFGVAEAVAADIARYVAVPELGDRAGPLGAIAIAEDAVAPSVT